MTRHPRHSLAAIAALAGVVLIAGSAPVAGAEAPRRPVKTRPADAAYNQLLREAARRTSQGQHALALDSYRRMLEAYPDDLTATRGTADALVALGRRDEAETFLRQYLSRKGYEEGVWRSLADIHRAQQKYELFLNDVVEVLKSSPAGQPLPLNWALRSLEDLSDEPATASKIEPAVRKLISERSKDKPEIRILMADVLLRKNDVSGALAEVTEADRLSKSSGQVLYQFAEELYGSGRAALAGDAFIKAADAGTSPVFKTQAWSRVADIAREENKPAMAARAYESIARFNPGGAAQVDALLALADIQQTRLRNYDAALAAYKSLEGNPALGNRQGTLYLQMADCNLRMNHLDDAVTALSKLKSVHADQEVQAEGEFMAAEIKFFKGDFSGAQAAYQSLAENFTRTRKTNDAVGRYLQIARAQDQGQVDALKLYAQMEQFTRMSDTTSVLATSHRIQQEFAATDLAADAMVREAEIFRGQKKYDEAVALCEKAVAEHPKARSAAYALAVVGDICLKELADRKRALATFERLLDEYPENLQAAEVRRTVERLRRNSDS